MKMTVKASARGMTTGNYTLLVKLGAGLQKTPVRHRLLTVSERSEHPFASTVDRCLSNFYSHVYLHAYARF